ncbi:transglycosylase SLT domain-containing protein [candidate division KSB1 bacterium]
MRRIKWLFAFSYLLLAIIPCAAAAQEEMPPVTSEIWTDKYDRIFSKYAKHYFGAGIDWKWFKAQAIAESNLKDNAKSWVGAKGIMQIMPRTFEEIRQKNPEYSSITEPRWNIAAGIYYNSQMYNRWKDIPDHPERLRFMFASYNAGRGTMLRAQRVSREQGYGGLLWQEIVAVATEVPRWRHSETIGYISKIHILMNNK